MGDEGLIDNGLHTQLVQTPARPVVKRAVAAIALGAAVVVVTIVRVSGVLRGKLD